jgi:hypothetical protein
MLKIGIIGEGITGQLPGAGEIISNHTSCTYSGIYLSDMDRARELAAQSDIPVFTSYQAFLSGCDAIIVESTGDIDSEYIIEALKNTKHILLKKPLDWHDEELEYLFKLSEEANTLLQLREPFLFHPVLKTAEPYIHSPAFMDYQIGISSDPHVEKLNQLITNSVLQCMDIIFHLNNGRVLKHDTVFSPDLFGFPGVIHGRIEFDNGCIANITCDGYAEQEKSVCYIYQENRQVTLNFLNKRLLIKDRSDGEERPKSFSVPVKSSESVIEEIVNFTDAILNKSYDLASPDRYLQSFKLARKMIENLPIHELQM